MKGVSKMKVMKQYVVDAFTDKVFTGNPAAICIMEQWLSDETIAKVKSKSRKN